MDSRFLVIWLLTAVTKCHSVSFEEEYKEEICKEKGPYPLLLIGLDGFRPDYLKRGLTPNVAWIGKDGVQAEYMTPMFPASTAPNFYSITTGLYPESHGIVDNCFEDPDFNDTFCSEDSCWRREKSVNSTKCDPKWWNGEPIWITAAKNKLKTGSYFWKYGAEAPIKGVLPTYSYKFNISVPMDERTVDIVTQWLDMPKEKRPQLMMVYFKEPDLMGHANGPSSILVDNVLVKIDALFHRLLRGLQKRSLLNCINIIVLSDHGMTGNDCSRIIHLQDYELYTGKVVDNIMEMGSSTAAMWTPKAGVKAEVIRDALRGKIPHFRIYLKNELPKRLHLANSKRTEDIVVMADCNWMIGYNTTVQPWPNGGTHGYDAIESKMQAFFVARGPDFKKGIVVPPFQNIEVYNLMADLLGIKPAPNNGTQGSLSHLLKSKINLKVANMTGDGHNFDNRCESMQKDGNKNSKIIKTIQKKIFPWGLPKGGAGQSGCLLTRRNGVIGYSKSLKLPLWQGERLLKDNYRTKNKEMARNKQKRRTKSSKTQRPMDDTISLRNQTVNLKNKSKESEGAMIWTALSLIESNYRSGGRIIKESLVPMYEKFYQGLWSYLKFHVNLWSSVRSPIYTIVGVVFDEDENGFRDTDAVIKKSMHKHSKQFPIPTHYYAILTRCIMDTKQQEAGINGVKIPHCKGKLDTLAIILPHHDIEACATQTSAKCLLENVITVRDIERLTGINFFGGLRPVLQAQVKTRLPLKIWDQQNLAM